MRLARFMVYTLMFLYIPLILAMVAGMIWLGYTLTSAVFLTWRFPLAVLLVLALDTTLLASCVILLFGLLPLILRDSTEHAPGIEIRESENPRLFAVLRRIAARMETTVPNRFYLHHGRGASIGEMKLHDETGRPIRQRVLQFGAALVLELRADEFIAILCHEIAHAAGGDTRLSRFAMRFYTSMMLAIGGHMEDSPDGRGPGLFATAMQYLLLGYFLLFSLFFRMEDRAQELRADRRAAEVCGAEVTRNALIRVAALASFDTLDPWKIANRLAEREEPVQNLFDHYRKARAAISPARLTAAENDVLLTPHTLWSTHPRVTDRIKVIGSVTSRGISAAQPATALFTDWPRLEQTLSDEVMLFATAIHAAKLKKLDRDLRRG